MGCSKVPNKQQQSQQPSLFHFWGNQKKSEIKPERQNKQNLQVPVLVPARGHGQKPGTIKRGRSNGGTCRKARKNSSSSKTLSGENATVSEVGIRVNTGTHTSTLPLREETTLGNAAVHLSEPKATVTTIPTTAILNHVSTSKELTIGASTRTVSPILKQAAHGEKPSWQSPNSNNGLSDAVKDDNDHTSLVRVIGTTPTRNETNSVSPCEMSISKTTNTFLKNNEHMSGETDNYNNHEKHKNESDTTISKCTSSDTADDNINDNDNTNDNTNNSDSDSDIQERVPMGTIINDNGHCQHVLSEYELLRLRNIERNNARLKALGLVSFQDSKTTCTSDTKRKQSQSSKAKRRKGMSNTPAVKRTLPTRRSTRSRRSTNTTTTTSTDKFSIRAGDATNLAHNQQQQQTFILEKDKEEEQFEVSPVVQYAMDDMVNTGATKKLLTQSASISSNDCGITSLLPVAKRLFPPKGLGAIYTMQFYPSSSEKSYDDDTARESWLVGAGKSGIVALWDCNWNNKLPAWSTEERRIHEEEEDKACVESAGGLDPILSWKAHGGRWIADARFLPNPTTDSTRPSRLVTAANDGTVCLWDLTTVSVQSGAPKLLHRTGKELHTSGIFAMDVLATATPGNTSTNTNTNTNSDIIICTGSKDKTVVVTQLNTMLEYNNNCAPLWKSNYHTGKVGAVKFRGSTTAGDCTVASASDDGHVAIHDYRKDGRSKPVAVLDNAHDKPHSLVWDPLQQNILMTAGLDDAVKLWDIRFLSTPLCSCYGHVPTGVRRRKRIHHPVFYTPYTCSSKIDCTSFILTGGEGSNSLSMFRHGYPYTQCDRKDTIRSTVFSRGILPDDCGDVGTIAVHKNLVAASVDNGEVILLAC